MVSAWATGAAINVCGSILINLGTNVMKLGHNRRAACELPIRPPIRTFQAWQLGVSLFILGNILNFFSFGFAAQSLLSALGSVQFVSNVFFASAVLGEKVTRRVIVATICIVGGCVLLVSFGNHQSQTLTVADMLSFYSSPVYITFLVILVLATGCLYFVYHYGQQKLVWMGREAIGDQWVRLLPVTYALFSGMVGTQSVLFCKTLSTLLRTTIAGDSQLQSWFFWLTFLFFVATAAFWISRLNLALQLFPAIMIVPMMQISWTLFSILSGGIYFQEYKTFNATSGFGFAAGVTVVFIGVYLLTPGKKAYLKQYADLEADLVPHGPDGASGPMADMATPLADYSRRSSTQFDVENPDAQETTSLLGSLKANGAVKGLSSSALQIPQPLAVLQSAQASVRHALGTSGKVSDAGGVLKTEPAAVAERRLWPPKRTLHRQQQAIERQEQKGAQAPAEQLSQATLPEDLKMSAMVPCRPDTVVERCTAPSSQTSSSTAGMDWGDLSSSQQPCCFEESEHGKLVSHHLYPEAFEQLTESYVRCLMDDLPKTDGWDLMVERASNDRLLIERVQGAFVVLPSLLVA